MIRRLDPNEPADRLQIARNASVAGIAMYALVVVVLVSIAIFHPAAVIRVGAAIVALLFVAGLTYHIYLYRYLGEHPDAQIEVRHRRRPSVSRKSMPFVFSAFGGILLLGIGGRLHKAVLPWQFPVPQQTTALSLAGLGVAILVLGAGGIIFVNVRTRHLT